MYRREPLVISATMTQNMKTIGSKLTFRTVASSGKPPTVKISHISITIKPMRNNCISLVDSSSQRIPLVIHYTPVNAKTNLRPTAAFFLSDLHNRKADVKIDMNASMMEPVPY